MGEDDPPFNGNGTIGRLLTLQVPRGPMVRRPPDACTAPYERAKAAFEAQPWYVRWTTSSRGPVGAEPTAEMGRAKEFQRECEKWPEEIPQSMFDDTQQRLTDHLTGKVPLPPEESLRLRRDLDFLYDVYRPGPGFTASLSPAEQAWLHERNLRWGNNMAIALLGPVFGGPGALTRLLGGSEQQVAAVNEQSSAFMAIARTRTLARMAAERRAVSGEQMSRAGADYHRGARLEGLDPRAAARAGTVVSRNYQPLNWNAVVPKKGPYKGQNREDHVRQHNQDNPSKAQHGVFYGDGVARTNQAWQRAQELGIRPDAYGRVQVPMNELVGRAGGMQAPTGQLFYSVHIQVVPGTNHIITAYPGP